MVGVKPSNLANWERCNGLKRASLPGEKPVYTIHALLECWVNGLKRDKEFPDRIPYIEPLLENMLGVRGTEGEVEHRTESVILLTLNDPHKCKAAHEAERAHQNALSEKFKRDVEERKYIQTSVFQDCVNRMLGILEKEYAPENASQEQIVKFDRIMEEFDGILAPYQTDPEDNEDKVS